jgi:hypothetical protein
MSLKEGTILSRSPKETLIYLRRLKLYLFVRAVLGEDFEAYLWPVSRLESILGTGMVKTEILDADAYLFQINVGKYGHYQGECVVSRERIFSQFKIDSARSYQKFRKLIRDLLCRIGQRSWEPVTVLEAEETMIPRQGRTWTDDCFELLGFTPDELETVDADSND